MGKTQQIRAAIKIVNKLLRNDYESEQKALLFSAKKRLIGLSRKRTIDSAELRRSVEEISNTVFDAFYLDEDEDGSLSSRAIQFTFIFRWTSGRHLGWQGQCRECIKPTLPPNQDLMPAIFLSLNRASDVRAGTRLKH